MVGVPGRSKACQTCKRRHVACDLQHLNQPACGQCTKSKRVCVFPQSHIFVNHDEGTHKTVYRKSDGERNHLEDTSQVNWPKDVPHDHTGYKNSTRASAWAIPFSPDTILKPFPATALMKYQFLANARHAISSGNRDDSEFPQFWSSAITSQSLDSRACRTSPALACYTAWIGRQSADPHLIDASRRLYVQGLREVQQSVDEPDTALSDETLSACIGLIVYEAMECPDRSYSAYHKHINGCSALIKLRGIDAHRDGVGHDLFRGFRYIAVIKALQDHRPTYLAAPDWSSIPFSLHPKDIHDRLLDILAIGANYLSDSDRLATTPPSQIPIALLDIDDRCLWLDSELDIVYADLESQHKGPLYWSTSPSVSLLDNNDLEISTGSQAFRVPICFPDEETARLLTLYWAQQCLLRMGRGDIKNALLGMRGAGMIPRQASDRVDRSLCIPPKSLIETAHLVLRSRDYCCSSQGTILRYSVPLNITLDILANKPELYGEEIKFAKEVKRQISQRYLRITQFTGTLKNVKEA